MSKEKLTVVKVGGGVLEKPEEASVFLERFTSISGRKILVHGGGRMATELAQQMGVEVKMVEGRRITDEEMLRIVVMMYGGWVNKKLVAELQAMGVNAVGLSGADANLIPAHKRPVKEIDYGFVGDIDGFNSSFTHTLLESGVVPVVAPLSHDTKGMLLNTNADTIATITAVGMAELYDVTLFMGFEKEGVMLDPSKPETVIPLINQEKYQTLKSEKVIVDGMIPKMDNAFDALRLGVSEVVICKASSVGAEHGGTAVRQ